MNKIEPILSKIYYDPANEASFGSVKKLYDAAKLQIPNIKEDQVQRWLSGELAYTLHFPARRRFKRNKIIVNHINEQ